MLERFKEIFAGYDKAYGYTKLKGEISEKGKNEAKSFAKREPVTDLLWQKHLNSCCILSLFWPPDPDRLCWHRCRPFYSVSAVEFRVQLDIWPSVYYTL